MRGGNQNGVVTENSLYLPSHVQSDRKPSHPGLSSRARTFSTPLSFHTAYSVLVPVVIGTWSSKFSNSHVTSALRPVNKSNRTMAKSGQVSFSALSFMLFPPCQLALDATSATRG